jgi:SAM-dependent MidA family methyltransferase
MRAPQPTMSSLSIPSLPEPDAAERDHSARVVDGVRAEIARSGGWISFAHYMQFVLYAPGLGYYVAGARKFGVDGDFVTAPETTPLFAQALAAQVAPILAATAAREVVEFGAGSGALAADVLNALALLDALPSRYAILEVSPDLRDRQRAHVARVAPDQAARVEWLDALPATIDGAVVMNEVLDAIPPHVIARRNGQWFERGVTFDTKLRWGDQPLGAESLRALAAERFPTAGDYVSEVNPSAEALVEDVGRRMTAGALLVIDYGFPRDEYYHAQRSEGTLMGHYRHRAHADPFLWPGLSDLTAHVDFTAIALAGERAGMQVVGYAPQAAFLMGCGILERLRSVADPMSVAYLREAAAVNKLTSPAEMGELFKVLALAKSEGIRWPGFAVADRSHRL